MTTMTELKVGDRVKIAEPHYGLDESATLGDSYIEVVEHQNKPPTMPALWGRRVRANGTHGTLVYFNPEKVIQIGLPEWE